MKKYEIIKDKREFDEIIHNAPYLKNRYYVIYNKERSPKFPRFGLAVGKKIGNAVTRNRVKRQMRAIIDNNKNLFQNTKDYIIIIKKNFLDLSFSEMEIELKRLLEK
ncbi:MAG: ribonuclease P protein component [Bacilli bacterium]|nr:ribonuclease P protein component [Bacilli bacterium]